MPISLTGRADVRNSCSMTTASLIIIFMVSSDGLWTRCLYIKQAKSQCRPSSRLMSSFEKVSPGISPLFFSQKIAAKEPEKKIPSTAAKAIILSPKPALSGLIQSRAHRAFFMMHGIVWMALNKRIFSSVSLMRASISRLYISE